MGVYTGIKNGDNDLTVRIGSGSPIKLLPSVVKQCAAAI